MLVVGPAVVSLGQIDPERRSLLELGYDQPLTGNGPQGIYAYYYYNNPRLFEKTNVVLRAAVAPVYLDGEIGFKQLISSRTDLGLGLYGGAFGDNFYEVRQGTYFKSESFDGYGAGGSASVYHLLNPGMRIPLHVVARGGVRYSTYAPTDKTSDLFEVPDDRLTSFVRAGLRLAGKEPLLYPELGLELSIWYERQWRSNTDSYGFNEDRGDDHGDAPRGVLIEHQMFGRTEPTMSRIGAAASAAQATVCSPRSDTMSAINSRESGSSRARSMVWAWKKIMPTPRSSSATATATVTMRGGFGRIP